MNNIQSVLPAFRLKESCGIELYGNGLINSTWKVTSGEGQYILQKLNDKVFEDPEAIAYNIKLISDHLKKKHPAYNFVSPFPTVDGNEMIQLKGKGFFRLFPFIIGSHSKTVIETPAHAYEAASQFGRFTNLLADFDVIQLKQTIPHFHDLDFRFQQFLLALENGDQKRIASSMILIKTLKDHSGIVEEYKKIKSRHLCKLRVTHHDTKISNVLFNSVDKGICVIDLDTIMPGYFISDMGDMIRTYISPVSEEERDFSKIIIRDEFYRAIVQGYYEEMKKVMTPTEIKYFFYAGKFMIYMQALRFMTDHLDNDVYYGAKYEGHNFVRSGNQVKLLERYLEKEKLFSSLQDLL